MKHKIIRSIHIGLCLAAVFWTSCTKDFLEIKSDKSKVVPTTLKDLQALLDNTGVMNTDMPSLPELGADNYYLTPASFQSISGAYLRNSYIWAKDLYEGFNDLRDWNYRYQQLFYANMVLEGLEKCTDKEKASSDWNTLKGSALFYRAWAFNQLAQIFCKAYDPATADADLGIPLRTESDINLTSKRATVKETYDQIISDLQASIALLPVEVIVKTRPSKPAAEALLSRVYLEMAEYSKALKHAKDALALYGTLMDFNTLDTGAVYPFPRFNEEVVFHAVMGQPTNFTESRLDVDSNLLRMYHPDDLRTELFFTNVNGMRGFKGNYNSSPGFFSGITTSEVVLTAAECYARQGDVSDALKMLNGFLVKRYRSGKYVNVNESDAQELLRLVLDERRKELIFRGIRWSDLRRLNKEPAFQVTLKRVLNGTEYTLPPNDPRYVLPIPDLVIFSSGIEQNPR